MKMNFIIPPVKHMELVEYNGMKAAYCLAHLCLPECNPDFKQYKQFFIDKKKEGFHVILDNSAAEDSLVTIHTLLDLTEELMPTEVIAPDVLYNEKETRENMFDFLRFLIAKNLDEKVKVFGCPQGDSPESFLKSYLFMLENPMISTIGLSKLAVPKSFASITDSNSVSVNRLFLIKKLHELDLIKKPIHCLGMRNITEFKQYKHIPLIRSTDSCYTVLSAIKGERLDKNTVIDHINSTPHDYFFWDMTEKEIERAKYNITQLKEIIEDE